MLLLNSIDNFVSLIIDIGEILYTCILLYYIGVWITGIRDKESWSNRKELENIDHIFFVGTLKGKWKKNILFL